MIAELLAPEVLIFLVPIVAIVMGLGTGMLAIFLGYQKRKEMFALYHQERMAAIEKGIELPALPEDFFHEDGRPPRRSGHGTLLGGLILTFLGLTLYLALHFTVPRMEDGGDAAIYALIPLGIGVACLIYYFTVGRKLAAAMEEEQKAKLAEAAQRRNPSV
jgi:cytochrome bd-type quinol oxidase subunit 1